MRKGQLVKLKDVRGKQGIVRLERRVFQNEIDGAWLVEPPPTLTGGAVMRFWNEDAMIPYSPPKFHRGQDVMINGHPTTIVRRAAGKYDQWFVFPGVPSESSNDQRRWDEEAIQSLHDAKAHRNQKHRGEKAVMKKAVRKSERRGAKVALVGQRIGE